MADFYPRPPRGGRHQRRTVMMDMGIISIHALREEGDAEQLGRTAFCMISIHALREEGDTAPVWRGSKVIRFLSTPSARRATKKPVG